MIMQRIETNGSHPKTVFACGLISVLIALYIVPSVHELFGHFDLVVAYEANDLLKSLFSLAPIVALLNTRVGDVLLIGILTAAFMIHALRGENWDVRSQRIAYYLWVGAMCLSTYALVCLTEGHFPRPIPVVALPNLVDIRQYCPIHLHTDPNNSFPSGHALAYCLFTIMYLRRQPRLALLVATLGGLMLISRLMVGIHWLSDIIFGGLPLAILVAAVAQETRLRMTLNWAEVLVSNLVRLTIRRFPTPAGTTGAQPKMVTSQPLPSALQQRAG